MALISSPDPMPVDVISVFGLVGEAELEEPLAGEMAELIGSQGPRIKLSNLSAIHG